MKCRYTYCKCGGEVDKNVAIKDGKAYYHDVCYQELKDKEIIRDYIGKLLPNEMTRNVNCFIKSTINDKCVDSKFLIYTIEHILKNNSKLNSVYGISYYLNNSTIIDDYNNKLIHKKYTEISNDGFEKSDDEVTFTYTSSAPDWLKIL